MKNEKNYARSFYTKDKTIIKIAVGAYLLVGLTGINYSLGPTRDECNLPYQGYNADKANGVNILVFDEKSLEDRIDLSTGKQLKPQVRAEGNPSNYIHIETNPKRYNLKVKSPLWYGNDTIINPKKPINCFSE